MEKHWLRKNTSKHKKYKKYIKNKPMSDSLFGNLKGLCSDTSGLHGDASRMWQMVFMVKLVLLQDA